MTETTFALDDLLTCDEWKAGAIGRVQRILPHGLHIEVTTPMEKFVVPFVYNQEFWPREDWAKLTKVGNAVAVQLEEDLRFFWDKCQWGFHPDTSAANYVDASGKRSFNRAECQEFEMRRERLFKNAADPYAAGLEAFRRFEKEGTTLVEVAPPAVGDLEPELDIDEINRRYRPWGVQVETVAAGSIPGVDGIMYRALIGKGKRQRKHLERTLGDLIAWVDDYLS